MAKPMKIPNWASEDLLLPPALQYAYMKLGGGTLKDQILGPAELCLCQALRGGWGLRSELVGTCEGFASLTGVVVLAQAGRGTARGWPGYSWFWHALSLLIWGLRMMVVVGRKVSPGVAQTLSPLLRAWVLPPAKASAFIPVRKNEK